MRYVPYQFYIVANDEYLDELYSYLKNNIKIVNRLSNNVFILNLEDNGYILTTIYEVLNKIKQDNLNDSKNIQECSFAKLIEISDFLSIVTSQNQENLL